MITDFKVTVVNSAGRPIPGAAIRLIGTAPLFDATITQFGQSPVRANQDGVFRVEYGVPYGGTNRGVYIIYATAPGYEEGSVMTDLGFVGVGNWTIVLNRTAASEAVDTVAKTGVFVSPLYSVGIVVDAAAPAAPWELIETTVIDENGVDSVIESIIDNGKAYVDLRSRLRLKPQLHLIGDGTVAQVDPDFSASFRVTIASITAAGTTPIGQEFNYLAANAFPESEGENDLSSFTNETGLASWLSPWGVSWGKELPVFDGQYADALVWLTKPGAGDYTLQAQFYDINRAPLGTSNDVLPTALFAAKKAVRVRIPVAGSSAYYARLTVTQGGADQTKPLFVRYIHA